DLDMLLHPAQHFGPDSARSLATVVQDSLRRAFAELSRMLGPDPAGWRWGSIHVARATHPLASLLTTLPEACTTTLSAPRDGSGDTVCDTAYGPDFVQASGATFRVAIDVGGWDGSLAMNAPGQSGAMDSPHYTDLFDPWARGESFPLLFSRDRVDAVARKRIRLTPR
ncbi:MAG TPA: penicillin acylase family protein, partial [Zeimonas sp.]|nr:penicillin acylase family protein [Zeimonas sp.]